MPHCKYPSGFMLLRIAIAVAILFAGAVVALVVVVAVFDFNRLKPLITARVANFSGRQLEIGGDLNVRKSLSPSVEISDIRFENAKWAKDPKFVAIEKLSVRIKLLELLRGRVVMPYLKIEGLRVNLEKDAEGRANWQFTGASPAEAAAETILPEGRTDFPAIGSLSVRDARVVYRVAGKTLRDAQIDEATGHSDNRGVALRAQGKYQERPSQLRVYGDSVGRLWAADRPYAIEIKLETGAPPDTPKERFAAHAKGTLTNAFDQGRFGLKLTVEGSDMAQLYPLAGVVLPKTPPYSLTGMLGNKGNDWRFDDFQGRMGDSDLAGDLAIRSAADPPRMDARFVSDKLDFDDLAGLVGAPPSTGEGETASAEQKAEAKQQEAEERIIPATAIELERLHAMDIHAKLDAKRVSTKRIPIDNISLAIVVEDGVLQAKPARFKLGEGTIDLAVTLHADRKPVRAEIEGDLRNVPLRALFKSTAFQDESSGMIDGRMHLRSEGGSVREMAAHVDGEAFVAMSRGKISHLLMELIGLDVFESIGVAISGDEPIEIRCALAKLAAENGRVKVDPLVMDTTDTKITGKGEVDLASEKINVLVTPHSKDFSPFTLSSPIRIGGKLADRDVFPDAAKLGPGDRLKQIVSTTLSAIIGLLPPMDMVLANDSPCRDLLTEVRESNTEVSETPAR